MIFSFHLHFKESTICTKRQFNHLFEYTNFALTDFIYCRDFESQTEITLG